MWLELGSGYQALANFGVFEIILLHRYHIAALGGLRDKKKPALTSLISMLHESSFSSIYFPLFLAGFTATLVPQYALLSVVFPHMDEYKQACIRQL